MTMKIKKFLSIIVLLLISSVVSLMANPFKFNWDFGTFYFGGLAAYEKDSMEGELEIDVQLFDFRFETENGFSISLSPFDLCLPLDGKEHSDLFLSLVNCSFAYDVFKFKKNIQLMPFVSLHLGLEGLKNSWADCGIVFKTFPRYSDSQEQNLLQACNIDFNIFTAKAGFRYAYLKPQLYLDVGVNVLLFTMLFFGNSGNSE